MEFYAEHGWVMMPRLVAPEFAEGLLHIGQARRDERIAEGHTGRTGSGPASGPTSPMHKLALDEQAEPFRSFMFSERMHSNAMRLTNRKRLKGVEVPMRYRVDILGEKPPGAAGASAHQDAAEHGSDRVGELQFWMALATVTPDMSAMRFISRSHREGPLGSTFNSDGDGGFQGQGDLLQQYPGLLTELETSPPFYYEPGDVTV